MRIGIDLEPLYSEGSRNRGIGNFVRNQLTNLFQIDRQNKYYLVVRKHGSTFFQEQGYPALFNQENVEYLDAENLMFALHSLDIFHVTSPFEFDSIYNRESIPCKLIVTVYDLIPLVYEKIFLGNASQKKIYWERLNFIKQADGIIAISEKTKQDVINFLNVPEKKIHVVYGGGANIFRRNKKNPQYIKEKYHIKNNYILSCTGSAVFHKNLPGIIKSFSFLDKEIKASHDLVIVCRLSQKEEEDLKELAKHLGVFDNLKLTNYVPLEDLISLYNHASLFILLSLYEGFGLPVLEAMSCGTPVIAANTSSLPELVGNAGILVNPQTPQLVAHEITRVLTNKSLRVSLIYEGLKQVTQFSWQDTGKKTLQVYEKIFNGQH